MTRELNSNARLSFEKPLARRDLLAAQSELIEERAIAVEIFLLEIIEKASSLAHDLE